MERGSRGPRRQGVSEAEIARLTSHKVLPATGPSRGNSTIELGPKTLCRLIALYEHKVFTQSVIWGINAFDQWGVELGKKLADSLAPAIEDLGKNTDPALHGLLAQITKWASLPTDGAPFSPHISPMGAVLACKLPARRRELHNSSESDG